MIITKALPATGGGTSNSDALDLGEGAGVSQVELEIVAPALTTTELPDDETVTYVVQTDTASAFSSPTDMYDQVVVQTGSGGAGAVTQTVKVGLPSDCERYVRVSATTSSGAGDCSGSSVTLRAVM